MTIRPTPLDFDNVQYFTLDTKGLLGRFSFRDKLSRMHVHRVSLVSHLSREDQWLPILQQTNIQITYYWSNNDESRGLLRLFNLVKQAQAYPIFELDKSFPAETTSPAHDGAYVTSAKFELLTKGNNRAPFPQLELSYTQIGTVGFTET